jgi:anthranilate phosphoribosyltransferase
MYLMIDNYDSFTYNLYALFRSQGVDVKVIKNDEYIPAEDYDAIIISPGPSSPENAGTSLTYLKNYTGKKPVFGVCLGMQCIGLEQGYKIKKAATVKHGKSDRLEVSRESVLFRGLPETFSVVRYHSLAVDINDESGVAHSATDGTVMAYEDKQKMLFGVQFHPESIMSEQGSMIVKNFVDYVEHQGQQEESSFTVEESLKKLVAKESLLGDEAVHFFNEMVSGNMTDAQIAASLVALGNKGETPEETAALVSVLDKHKKPFGASHTGGVDTCGTGGDGKSTVNVSTGVSIISAALGNQVVKHGNRAQSGKVGSADILEQLGLDLNYIDSSAEDFFKAHNYVFMMAPHYHPALKGIGKVRRELKIPTIFNLVGPLVNPADPQYQIIGLSNTARLDFMAEVLMKLGRNNVTVYASSDGYDEVSSSDITECISIRDGKTAKFTINPADFFEPFPMPVVNDNEDAMSYFIGGLSGKDKNTAKIFALNNALVLYTMDGTDLKEGYKKSMEAIESGTVIEKLQEITGENLSA